MAGLLHGQYLKFLQRISPVVVALDFLAGFYIKYCPGIVFVMARPFFITSEGKNLHNVLAYCWAIPVVLRVFKYIYMDFICKDIFTIVVWVLTRQLMNMKSGQIHQNILNMGMDMHASAIGLNILNILK